MTIALTMWSGATALCGLADGFWTLFLGRAAVGTAESAGSPTGMSLLSDYFAKDKRSTAIGIWSLRSGIGLAPAFFIARGILDLSTWRWELFAPGIPAFLL